MSGVYREWISGDIWCIECDNLLSDCCCERDGFEQRQLDDIMYSFQCEDLEADEL